MAANRAPRPATGRRGIIRQTGRVPRFAAEVRQLIPVRQFIRFGSYAHGTANQWSDIDVALVADHFVDAAFIDIRPFGRLRWNYAIIEPHPFSTRRFANALGDPFIEEIKRTGIVVG